MFLGSKNMYKYPIHRPELITFFRDGYFPGSAGCVESPYDLDTEKHQEILRNNYIESHLFTRVKGHDTTHWY